MNNDLENTFTPKIVVGLDIGTTKIATIIGYENAEGKLDIIGYGKGDSLGVQHGLILNINRTVEGINISKNSAISRSGQEFHSVFAGVAGRHINSTEYKHIITRINGRVDVIKQEEIDKMVEDLKHLSVNLGEQILTIIPQRFLIDGVRETTDPVGELGERIMGYFQIITGNEFEISKIIRCIKDCDLSVEDIILEPIASALVCLTHEEKQQGVVLVDIGGGTTDIVIYQVGNPVFTKVIPIGGAVITRDIATVCQIPEDMAERLKISYGTCVIEKSNKNNFITIPQFQNSPPRQISEPYLAEIIYSRVHMDIVSQIKKAIDESGYAKKNLLGVVLTGGGSSLRHIKELCQYELQRNTRIGIPDIGFVNSIPSELKHPMFATSLGLLKHGVMQYAISDIDEEGTTETNGNKKNKNKTKEKNTKKNSNGSSKKTIWDYIKGFFDRILEKTS